MNFSKDTSKLVRHLGRMVINGITWLVSKARDKAPIYWAVCFTGVGVVLGMTIGFYMAQTPQSQTAEVAVTPGNVPEQTVPSVQYDDIEYDVPVRVDRSERALKKYRYEEDVIPEAPDRKAQQSDTEGTQDPIDELVASLNERQSEDASTARVPDIVEPTPETAGKPWKGAGKAVQEAWQRLAVETPGIERETRPLIAIVIDDVGIDQVRSRRSISLEAPLTLSFIPYGYNLQELVDLAGDNGHEVMLHMPMEPTNEAVDPGPNALLTSLSMGELEKRIDWDLRQFSGYIGINNHMGSKFTKWGPGMRLVLREMKRRGLVFLDSITSSESVAFDLARELDVPVARRDVFLDHVQDEDEIKKQLQRTERIARNSGHAIAIGHPHDETTDVLRQWIPDVQARGFRLVPVSAIFRRDEALRMAQETMAN